MAYQTIEATSVTEILSLINGQHSFFRSDTKGFCYRGQASENWSLIPTAFRGLDIHTDITTKEKALVVERDIYRGFYNRFRGMKSTQVDMQSPWELLCYAQHFGIPSRLLDWSANPLVALYFAVTVMPNDNAALWCLAREDGRYDLGKSINQLPEELSFLREFKRFSESDIAELSSDIAVIQPPEIDLRIRNQRGLFSVQYTSNPGDLVIDHVIELGKKSDILLKIRIPAPMKLKIKQDLEKFCIDSAFIYPDMDGVAQRLREQRESEYVEQEISISRLVAYMRDTFTKRIEVLVGDDKLQWKWNPGQYHELLLTIDNQTYAVRTEQVILETDIDAIASFVKTIEQQLLDEGSLKGTYYINFGLLRKDWREFNHETIKGNILEVIRATHEIEEFDRNLPIDDEDSLSILKTKYGADRVSVGFYPSQVWWESDDVHEILEYQKEEITQKVQAVKLHHEFRTILILSIIGHPKYHVKDYTYHVRTIRQDLAAIFLITHFDSGFAVDHVFAPK